jgi:hypothetical protein
VRVLRVTDAHVRGDWRHEPVVVRVTEIVVRGVQYVSRPSPGSRVRRGIGVLSLEYGE